MHTLHIYSEGVLTLTERERRSKRDNRVVTYLTDEELNQLDDWADKVNKPRAALLRQGIMEYLDRDRSKRVEEVVRENSDRLEQLVGALLDDEVHTHTSEDHVTKASETVEKTREIADTVNKRYNGTGLKTKELDRVIKDIAGGDPRTIRKYRRELIERGHAYEHPNENSDVWFLDREPWLNQVERYAHSTPDPRATAKDVLRDYPVTTHEVIGDKVVVAED